MTTQQPFHDFYISLYCPLIHIRSLWLCTKLQNMLCLFSDICQCIRDITHNVLAPCIIFYSCNTSGLICFLARCEPFTGIRVTHSVCIKLPYQIFNCRIAFLCPIALCHIDKVFFRTFISRFQNLFHDVCLEQSAFTFIRNSEARININFVKMVLHHIQAEPMNGCNRCIVY